MDSARSNNTSNSILVLKSNTRNAISNLLNPHKFLKTEKGLLRDWQGLAELCSISGELIPNIANDPDPAGKVLKIWHEKVKHEATIAMLMHFLKQLDREDIVDDILTLVEEDIRYSEEHLPDDSIIGSFDYDTDNIIITRDDQNRISRGLGPQKYDAFVLFEDDDISFATDLIEKMEKDYNLKFCVKERDLVSGQPEHDAIIKLITERCGRLIVILSPAFLQSNVNNFLYSLTQSIAIKQSKRKIIPIIYKECGPLRPELSYYFKLDYRRAGSLWNFWDKLYESIKLPDINSSIKHVSSERINLPQNSNAVNTTSSVNQFLSPNNQGGPSQNDSSTEFSLPNSVKTSSSMSNLPTTEVPQDNMIPSTSANSLGKYENDAIKKTPSFYEKFKQIKINFPNLKFHGNSSSKQKSEQLSKSENSEDITQESSETIIDSVPQEIKENKMKEKKEKKKRFTLKRNKKKTAVPNT